MVVLAGPPLLLFTAAAAALAGWLRTSIKLDAPYTRKIFHFVIFTTAGALHILGELPVVILFGVVVSGAVLFAVARGDGFPFYEAMARPTDAPRRALFVLVPLAMTAIGGLAAALLFGRFASVGYLVTGWGDAVGEPVGRAFGRHPYPVPTLAGVPATRTVEGSAAVCLAATLAAFVALVLGGVSPSLAAAAAPLCGVVSTAVEAFSHHGLDNLTVQIAASGTSNLILAWAV
jgi:phytol kinase